MMNFKSNIPKEFTKLYIVVPCYNEEAVIDETIKRLGGKLKSLISKGYISADSRMLFVDDGSKDATWTKIEGANKKNVAVGGVKLSRNRGHQNALLAGLMTAKEQADVIISMDADLQDDIDAIDSMLNEYYGGRRLSTEFVVAVSRIHCLRGARLWLFIA